MGTDDKSIRLLGLSRKEVLVFEALRKNNSATPLSIFKKTKVSRPAVYEILKRFKNRGLAKSYIKHSKKHWKITDERDLETDVYNAKKYLLNIEKEVEEIRSVGDATVIVHRGAKAIRKLIDSVIKYHKHGRLRSIQGDVVVMGWSKVYGVEGTNELNRAIKKNDIIVEAVLPVGWFERQTKLLGKKWAEDFEGRATITHEINDHYFQHGGQMFLFKDSLYLMSMNEEIIIEVRNSEIQKLILSMLKFIQDNSKKIDPNKILQKLLGIEK